MPLNKDALQELMPHAGAMCLLEAVQSWDERRIACRAHSHRDAANPLRSRGCLHAVCGIEYAVQAMAAHGALLSLSRGARPAAGYLAQVRDFAWCVPRLDDIEADLLIEAQRRAGAGDGAIYQFTIAAGGVELAAGRATVFLRGAETAS
ncbi:MAG: hydroxymyristoyl-ACP dehydratase [Gammaproteobacteria bacterium]|nr:hydroxymyristoyl-ACP dehydratase [Gammaproteobacteria bacterium]